MDTTDSMTNEARELLPNFQVEWAKYEAKGYQYGEDALEQVRFGFKIAIDAFLAQPAVQNAEPVAWISRESLDSLLNGGNGSRGTVPIHKKHSNVARFPLYAAPQHLTATNSTGPSQEGLVCIGALRLPSVKA